MGNEGSRENHNITPLFTSEGPTKKILKISTQFFSNVGYCIVVKILSIKYTVKSK